MDGFLVFDKPAGITSHDLVGMVRAVTGVKKVGHTGTLDPFATGVLPLAIGGATKLIRFLDESLKVYVCTIELGNETDTGDYTGEVVHSAPVPALTEAHVNDVLPSFLGDSLQMPPAYSAIKKDGKKLYEYAREGKEVTVPPRPITVHSLELTELLPTALTVRMTVSRGTYARVLGADIAKALGTRGHLAALERARSGPFFSMDALTIEDLAELVAAEPGHHWRAVLQGRRQGGVTWKPRHVVRDGLVGRLVPALVALDHLPTVDVDAAGAEHVRHGKPPPLAEAISRGERYVVVHEGKLLAVAERTQTGSRSIRVQPAP